MKKVIRVSQISVPLAHTKEEIFQKACALAQIPMKKVQSMQIMKQSVDARKKRCPQLYVYGTVSSG